MIIPLSLVLAVPLALVSAAPPPPQGHDAGVGPGPGGHAGKPQNNGHGPAPTSFSSNAIPSPSQSCLLNTGSPSAGAGGRPDKNGFSLREVGARNTLDWRIWLHKDGKPASFWHDVPLYPDERDKQVVNMVVEIPRWSDGKIEINRKEPFNPIFHDEKNGAPRYVESIWPHKSYPFSYGSIPQTWEDPTVKHAFTNEKGDKDPMDVFEIGDEIPYTGQIKTVKLLGALAPNDGGETDWKVLAIDVNDPLAPLVNNYDDVERYRPGLIASYRQWFTAYKIARGDGPIPIIGDYYQNATFTASTVSESHEYWKKLVSGKADVKADSYNYNQTTNAQYGDSFVQPADAAGKFAIPRVNEIKPAAERPSRFDRWFYLEGGVRLIDLPGQK